MHDIENLTPLQKWVMRQMFYVDWVGVVQGAITFAVIVWGVWYAMGHCAPYQFPY